MATETGETIARSLIAIAHDLRRGKEGGKPIAAVLDNLLDLVCEWREEFLENEEGN